MNSSYWLMNARLEVGFKNENGRVIGTETETFNLFNVDGGQFVSQGDKNITWTILALSMRTSEYIVDQLKKNNI